MANHEQVDSKLTSKELLVVNTFESLRAGYGAIAEQNILNPNSGWRDIVADMTEEEITLSNLVQNEEGK